MDLYGTPNKSIPQKVVIHIIEVLLLWLSFWILFQNGGNWIQNVFHIHNAQTDHTRRIIIFIFNVIIFVRIAITMFYLLKRNIPWEESIGVPMAFGVYYIGYSFFVLPTNAPINSWDYFAIILFIIGCTLNTGSELLRNQWKRKPENKGKIYTSGFFKYSRHINYFGDILWVTAYAIITHNIWSTIIPIFIFCFFAFYNAPKLDKYLKDKYPDYKEYAKKTKMLIPWIF